MFSSQLPEGTNTHQLNTIYSQMPAPKHAVKVWNPHVDQSASGVPLHVRTLRIRTSLHKGTSCLMLVSDTQTLSLKSRCFFNSPIFFGRCERVWALSSRFVSDLSIRGQRSGQRVGIRELHAVVTPGSTFDQTGWGEWSPPLIPGEAPFGVLSPIKNYIEYH